MKKLQISPSNAHPPSRLCPPHIRTSFPYRYWTLKILALSSSLHASYAISVRQTSALPAASFRFHLAMDTLAVRLTIPPVGFVADFHSQVSALCRAHRRKERDESFFRPALPCLKVPLVNQGKIDAAHDRTLLFIRLRIGDHQRQDIAACRGFS